MSRILFTTQPAGGHLRPLVPIAQAALLRGHTVAVSAPACMAEELAGYRLPHLVGGYDWRYDVYRMLPKGYDRQDFAAAADTFRALGEPLTRAFAGHVARRTAADILGHDWRPDLVVRELDEFGGYLAAEALGVPHAAVISFGGLDGVTGPVLGPVLDEGRRELGLPADPRGERLYRHLTAGFLPPELGASELMLPATRCYRHINAERAADRLPSWLAGLDLSRPLVFAAFGTVVYGLPGSSRFVEEAIAALGDVDCTAVLALGAGADTHDAARKVPGNVRLVDFVDQALMLEGCDLFVTHGGLNSMKEALRLGVPMVTVPVLDDHRHNAGLFAAAGLSRTVPLATANRRTMAHEIGRALADPALRTAARRAQRHLHALPALDTLVDDLEALITR
ncbi:glycosyltransferase [Streptomyces sp. MST-110588]|uniref:glycosyltransferase n=1 Tax=Streptomyces sp. MST-110588 TaxID=2833628 RepID=UPI001F5C6A29|nr:glycosyltransferase [Streptomyces sp. MST-110588]UNO40786.1 glycosyltransferase family 1 protein [Streptomyces sp. MST-110588]